MIDSKENSRPEGAVGAAPPGGRARRSGGERDDAAREIALSDALASARDTRALVIGEAVLGRCADVFREQFPGTKALVVADPATFAIAGRTALASLAKCGVVLPEPLLLDDPRMYAEHTYVDQLEAAFKASDAIPVAVGAGTINDLVKLAAHRVGRPYLCVATAASMDGYTAFGASITFQGSKQTFNCPAPKAVIADLGIIRRAPPEMTASGYADLLAKTTAGADWMLADALGVEPIDDRAWNIVQGGLHAALADPSGARRGDGPAIARLVEGLILGGFAMQWLQSSRPASGAEHQFSHLWDMEHHTHHGEAPPHGFKVGVATLAVTALYEQLFRHPIESIDIERCCRDWPAAYVIESRVRRIFAGEDFVDRAVEETLAKHCAPAELHTQLYHLQRAWPELKPRLAAQLVPAVEVKRRLQLVGAPTEPEQIGLPRQRLRDSFRRAYHIRRRFTVLDLAVRTGLLDELLEGPFGAGGIWEIEPAGTKGGASR